MTSTPRSTRRLGRGLASLMSNPVQVPAASPPAPLAQSPASVDPAAPSALLHLPIDAISPNPHQPRRTFDEEMLRDLADSIKAAGLIQPIVVRTSPDETNTYQLIAGERRWRAARLAGLATIPALLRETSDRQSAEIALIENLQRADLDPIERATGLSSLLERFGLTQTELSERVGLPRSTIANLLRLLQLPEPVRELLRAGELSLGHGKILVGLSDNQLCLRLAARCAQVGWSVRTLEREVERAQRSAPAATAKSGSQDDRPAHILDLEERLCGHLGTKVKIRQGRRKGAGRIIIDFYDLDQFDGLMQRIGFEQN